MKIFLENIFSMPFPLCRLGRPLAVFFFVLFVLSVSEAYPQNNTYNIRTVVIDAGHGGRDPGALGKLVKEKDIVLNITQKLGSYIKEYLPGVRVIYTRESDVFIPLDMRSEIANKHQADLFISVHANANDNHKFRGTETYTLGLHKTQENLEVAMKENAVMLYEEDYSTKYEGFDPNNPASYIIFNLLQGANREKSISMAELTEYQFKTRAGRQSRGVREAGFWVLKQASMPSILVEVGYVSNPVEEKFLNTVKGQDYLASAIFRAFRSYKNKVEHASVVIQQTDSLLAGGEAASNNGTVWEQDSTDKEHTIEYCVQISSSSKTIPPSSEIFKGIENIKERKIDGMYKYTVGSSDDYNDMVQLQNELRKKIRDCFVVAFYNGKRISTARAKQIQEK